MCLNIPHIPDHITAHAEVLGGPVLCPALLRPDNVSSGRHQGVGVTDKVLGWVIDRHHTRIILFNIHKVYKDTIDDYSQKIDDLNS